MGSKSAAPHSGKGRKGKPTAPVAFVEEDEDGDKCIAYQLDRSHYKLFCSYTRYFAELFAMTSYDIDIQFGGPNTITTARASFWINEDARSIRVDLTKVWDINPTPYALARVAYHEILECLLTKIEVYGKRRFCTEEEFEGLIHGVVRSFEGTHFELMWEAGGLKDAAKKFDNLKAVPGMVGAKALSILR
jgi:hypothetical protein